MVTLPLALDADAAFRAFCDVEAAKLWVPGLKSVRVVRRDPQGRAVEVAFEYGDALAYALVYAYDDEARRVRWVPSAGVRDGVSGNAGFDETKDGCVMSYALDHVRGRGEFHEATVARAFGQWVSKGR